ncbi:unnamed protein product [Lactuca virosa]|uniref:Myb/SANT-like domain-containing protein n=1 Tax=Lactuca virosa TaxID=75947 RepID=A0AAU9M5Q9_9ASTR|nr:unnamed protein product [Lactuca virosa]
MKFIKLCLVEKEKGNRPYSHFNKLGWANLEKGRQEETCKVEKIKVDKDFAKFRGTDLSIYKTYYAPLFRDSVAAGDHSMTPLRFINDDGGEENLEGNGDNEEINLINDEPLFPTYPQTSSSKRKKSKDISNNRSTNSKSSYLEEKLEVLLDSLSTKSTQTFPPTTPSPTNTIRLHEHCGHFSRFQ